MCASSSASCASGIINLVANFLSGLAQFVGFVASFGLDAPASEAVSVAKSSVSTIVSTAKSAITDAFTTIKNIATNTVARSNFLTKVGQAAITKIKNIAVGTLQSNFISQVCANVGNAILANVTAQAAAPAFNPNSLDPLNIKNTVTNCNNASGDSNAAIACGKDILGSIALVDPTGLASMAAAFMQPTCQV